MQQSPQPKVDIIALVLGVLAFIALLIRSFSNPNNLLLGIPFFFLFGLLWFYQGVKKVRAARTSQRSAHWYTQPSILVGTGAFAAIPAFIIGTFLSNSLKDIIIVLLLFIPSLVLLFVAAYFYFRGLWRKYTFQ